MTLTQLRYVIAVADTGSMNAAAKKLFISQPSLSAAVKELEEETGVRIFERTSRGAVLTPAGREFTGYARQVVQQYELIEKRYISGGGEKKHFSVSTQHYTFAVNAFIDTVRDFGMDEYELSVNEEKTYDVINSVRNVTSEIGVLYINDFNGQVLQKIFRESGLVFHPLFDCKVYAYMAATHPLAKKKKVSLEDLSPYPALAFDQGEYNSFYFAEEVLSTYDYARLIHATDRATLLNLMTGLNGYTLCSGIICEDLNGAGYTAVRLDSKEAMTIGYLTRQDALLSPIAESYIEHLSAFRDRVLD